KILFSKMKSVLEKDNNDLGDLAVWFYSTYLVKTESQTDNLTEGKAREEQQINIAQESNDEKPVKPTKSNNVKNTNNMASVFAKRAGVDKIKIETIIKDIQGTTSQTLNDDSFDDNIN